MSVVLFYKGNSTFRISKYPILESLFDLCSFLLNDLRCLDIDHSAFFFIAIQIQIGFRLIHLWLFQIQKLLHNLISTHILCSKISAAQNGTVRPLVLNMPSVGVFGIIHRYIFRFHPERFLYVLTIFSRCLKKLIHELLIQFLRNPSSTNFYINITGFQRFRHGSLQCLHIFSKSAVFFCIVFSNVKFLTNIT